MKGLTEHRMYACCSPTCTIYIPCLSINKQWLQIILFIYQQVKTANKISLQQLYHKRNICLLASPLNSSFEYNWKPAQTWFSKRKRSGNLSQNWPDFMALNKSSCWPTIGTFTSNWCTLYSHKYHFICLIRKI